MMKNAIKTTMAAVMMAALTLFAPQTQAASDSVTHDQAAVMIANLLGLYVGSDDSLDAFEASLLLTAAGIVPSDEGWQPGAILTIAEFARVMVGALDLLDEVDNPSDSKSYIEVLRNEGIGVEDISGGLDELRVPFGFFLSGLFGGINSSDPLENRSTLGEPDEPGLGTDTFPSPYDGGSEPITPEELAEALSFLELAQTMSSPRRTTPH